MCVFTFNFMVIYMQMLFFTIHNSISFALHGCSARNIMTLLPDVLQAAPAVQLIAAAAICTDKLL